MLEIIQKKGEETEQKESEIREWTKEDENKMGNIVDPYYELYFLRIRNLERRVVLSQTSFGHISTNSSTILMVSTAMESP